ncbi:MAG: hypothetical protein MI685_10825 [Chlorobiales bacterium]|nr:hypothetical protein [Chlorobiales bacterium]
MRAGYVPCKVCRP